MKYHTLPCGSPTLMAGGETLVTLGESTSLATKIERLKEINIHRRPKEVNFLK